QPVAHEGSEYHAFELVGPGFRDGVDDRTARAAELRVIHTRHDLEFLNGLERRSYLRTGARSECVVGVVAAIDRDVVVLTGLAGRNDGVVADLSGGCEYNAGQHGDDREIVAVGRRSFSELLCPNVAAD